MKKICLVCKIEFKKLPEHSQKYWETKKYCSYKCYWKDKIGTHRSEETKQKLRGHISWNKGRKFPERSKENHYNWKGGMVVLICKTCKKEFKVQPYRKDVAKYCSRKCKTDDNMGLTPINERDRKSKKYILWRTMVFKRDNYTCQNCGNRNGNGKTLVLNADHIKPFAYFPKLRLEVSNGITLCEDCHKKTDTFGVNMWRNFNKKLIAYIDNI